MPDFSITRREAWFSEYVQANTRCAPSSDEGLVDECPRAFGPVTLSPEFLSQPVAEQNVMRIASFLRIEREPSDELAAGLLDCCPVAKLLMPSIEGEKPRQDSFLNDRARRGRAAVQKTHDIRIAVQLEQIVDITLRKLSQHEAFCFQIGLHWTGKPVRGSLTAVRPCSDS